MPDDESKETDCLLPPLSVDEDGLAGEDEAAITLSLPSEIFDEVA